MNTYIGGVINRTDQDLTEYRAVTASLISGINCPKRLVIGKIQEVGRNLSHVQQSDIIALICDAECKKARTV